MIPALLIATLFGQTLSVRDEGTFHGTVPLAYGVDCRGSSITCSIDGGRWVLAVDGGTTGAPTDAKYITAQSNATLSAEVAPGADDQVPVSDSSSAATWRTVPDCADTAGNHLNYTQSSNSFSCGTTASTMSFMFAKVTTGQGPQLGKNDHLKFDTVGQSSGSNITLDTSTTYTKNNNVASLGRFTLVGGHCYRMTFFATELVFVGANTFAVFQWANADLGQQLNPAGESIPLTGSGHSSVFMASDRIECPSSNTRYEVRITMYGSVDISAVGGVGATIDGGVVNTYPSAVIQQLN